MAFSQVKKATGSSVTMTQAAESRMRGLPSQATASHAMVTSA